MPTRKQAEEKLEAELEALPNLAREELKKLWTELYGTPGPIRISRELLVHALAHRMQQNMYGGLDKATHRRLKKAAADLAAGRPHAPPAPMFKPGTRLLREWQGTVHEVMILEKGVQYRDKTWPSLSAVAREITGTRWSGPRFFGLKGAA
jgi:hypothetical protein